MASDTYTRIQSPVPDDREETPAAPITEACINWTSVTVPNATTFDPSGAVKLAYHASTSVTCDDPENAHFRFSLYLTGSSISADKIKDPKQSETFLAYSGTTDLSTHQITSLQFPFPSIFTFPNSSDLNVSYVYQVQLVDKDNTTLTESPLFYLEPGAHSASTPLIPQSSKGLSGGAAAGLAVGILIVFAMLALGGWRLQCFLQNRSVEKRRASVRASIRHLAGAGAGAGAGAQEPVTDEVELRKRRERGQGAEPLGRRSPPRYVSSPASPPPCARATPSHGGYVSSSPPRPPRPSSSRYSLDGPTGPNSYPL